MEMKYQWPIRDFLKFDTNTTYYSGVFTIRNCDWKFAVYRGKKGKEDYLAIYLYVADALNLAKGWSIEAEFTLTVVNQSSRENSETKKMKHKFCENEVKCGRSNFMRLDVFEGETNGFIRGNKCIVEVEFHKVKPAGLVDVKDLDFAEIENQFVPLLKEVFSLHSLHPSLLGKQNRIPPSFNDLGRVLKFLKEKKWKDMRDKTSREELQDLWGKLGKSGLDLHWLEPEVETVLGYKTEAEKVELENKLKALEEELRRKEKNVKKTRKDLKYAKRFEEMDLNEKIGYLKL